MIRPITALLAATMTLALVAGPAIGLPGLLKNKYQTEETAVECYDADGDKVGEVVYEGPPKLWPPNHKMQPVSIAATAMDEEGNPYEEDDVMLWTAGTHDEYLEDGSEWNGTGNTADDVDPPTEYKDGKGSVTNDHELRAERSGRGDGRTYTLDWQAYFENSEGEPVMCGSDDLNESGYDPDAYAYEVFVPHDMRCGADWKGGNKGSGGNGQCAKE